MVPERNPPAWFGYHLALLSVVPLIGGPVGLVALALGWIGLRAARRDAAACGRAHAWFAVAVGGIFGTVWTFALGAWILFRR